MFSAQKSNIELPPHVTAELSRFADVLAWELFSRQSPSAAKELEQGNLDNLETASNPLEFLADVERRRRIILMANMRSEYESIIEKTAKLVANLLKK